MEAIVNEFHLPAPSVPVTDNPTVVDTEQPTPEVAADAAPSTPAHTVDPVRSAAGRLGGQRVHRLAELGREYEKEHGLTPGRQRLKQLIQLGRRYEVEHGLRPATTRKRRKGDAWQEFLAALARVIKPAYRPAVLQLAASLRPAAKLSDYPVGSDKAA